MIVLERLLDFFMNVYQLALIPSNLFILFFCTLMGIFFGAMPGLTATLGVALLTTSTVLAAGFLILAASHMNTSATIGILMAITLIFALIVDFLLLPPLLLYFDSEKE